MAIIKPSKSSWWQGSCFTRQPPYVTVNIKLGSFRVHWRGILVDRVPSVRPSTVCRKFVLVHARSHITRATLVIRNATAPDAYGKIVVQGGERARGACWSKSRIPPVCDTIGGHARHATGGIIISSTTPRTLPLTRVASTQSHTQFFPKGPSETLAGHQPSSDIPSPVRCLAPLDGVSLSHARSSHVSIPWVLLPEVWI